MPFIERHTLRVEGKDDKYVIENLLSQHGIDGSVVDIKVSSHGDQGTGGIDALLRGMRTAVTTSVGRSVGFVLDADDAPENRWNAVRTRLHDVGLALPDEIPESGFVDDTIDYQVRVGVWMMPDNRRSGALEEFLKDLVDNGNPLLELAERSATDAKNLGAAFPNAKHSKAVLHTWLAWQENPGLRYGTAITARYFRHDRRTATAFVDWFRRVFDTTDA